MIKELHPRRVCDGFGCDAKNGEGNGLNRFSFWPVAVKYLCQDCWEGAFADGDDIHPSRLSHFLSTVEMADMAAYQIRIDTSEVLEDEWCPGCGGRNGCGC